ncbi:MAG: hypothetical protein AB7O73_02480 [Bacteroidia bacterium]
MKRIAFFLGMVFFSVTGIFSQSHNDSVGIIENKAITIFKIYLKDGTFLQGVKQDISSEKISLNEFNIGNVEIDKSKIKRIDSFSLRSNIIIETTSGSSYIGTVDSISGHKLYLQTEFLGVIQIRLHDIAKISHSNLYLSKGGGSWFSNPNATRYLFAPSAIPLNKREGYYQNAYLLANSVNVGLTNNISVGGGVVIPILFYVTPKVSFKVAKNLHLGAGVLFTQSFINDLGISAGIGYGLITYGNLEHNFTIGSGYGIAQINKEYKNTPMPILTLNGMTRISKRLSLVTENWFIPRGGYNVELEKTDSLGNYYYEDYFRNESFYSFAASLGLRLMPGVKTSVDFSVVCLQINPKDNLLVLPYLDFVYKF